MDKHTEILAAIEQWKISAAAGLDDIQAWRDVPPDDRLFHHWWPPRELDSLYALTVYLAAEIAAAHPRQDVAALQDVYFMIRQWTEERSGDSLPSSQHLAMLGDRAAMVLQAMEARLCRRDPGAYLAATIEGNVLSRHERKLVLGGNELKIVRLLHEAGSAGLALGEIMQNVFSDAHLNAFYVTKGRINKKLKQLGLKVDNPSKSVWLLTSDD